MTVNELKFGLVVVVAGFARSACSSKSGLQSVGVAGFGGSDKFGGLSHQLFAEFFELGLFSPDFRFGAGRDAAFVSAWAESSPWQFGHVGNDFCVLGGNIGIKRDASVDHGADTTKVGSHDAQ